MLKLHLVLDACCNHLGNYMIVREMIRRAKQANASYIKFQLFDHTKLSPDYPDFKKVKGFMMMTELDDILMKVIFRECEQVKITPMFTIFNENRIDFLQDYRRYNFAVKVASSEFEDHYLVDKILHNFTGRLIVMSTGMTNPDRIVHLRKKYSGVNPYIKYLYCVSHYPTDPKSIDVQSIFNFDGFSDHTMGIETTCNILHTFLNTDRDFYLEKHFTLSKNLPGKDHLISLEPAEAEHLMDFYNANVKKYYYLRRWDNA
jgi:sialic acid synthase SpsE